jgi:UDP-3-O-[3-hydroxymyristoyl] N-acetylglucosamine deacetylase
VATVQLQPAPLGTGIVFVRTDLADVPADVRRVSARWDLIVATDLCIVLRNEHGTEVATVEHMMAALHGLGVTDVIVALEGPEVPIMDGSARDFATLIQSAGIRPFDAPSPSLIIDRPIEVREGTSWARLLPTAFAAAPVYGCEIAFASAAIGEQRHMLMLTPDTFAREIAAARTFGFHEQAAYLWQRGQALGAGLENTIVIKDDTVMNEEGLRWADEFVRHKLLDAIGDMALCGGRLVGSYHSHRPSHRLHAQLARKAICSGAARLVTGDAAPAASAAE